MKKHCYPQKQRTNLNLNTLGVLFSEIKDSSPVEEMMVMKEREGRCWTGHSERSFL